MLMCMESVYVVGECKLLAKGCSCMVGCCSWYRVHLVSVREFFVVHS